jgi:DNA repair protein RecN (Recombination protein N)
MLSELRVRHLGVIDDQSLVLGPGLTALTGETGAGKTLIVDAIELLLGGRADPVLVRLGAPEAVVEGRFVDVGGRRADGGAGDGGAAGDTAAGESAADDGGTGADEVILGRVVPAGGRSRAYLDGRMVSSAVLAGAGTDLVDLHGQHAHQSLLSPTMQRAALDAAAGIDTGPLEAARAALRAVTDAQAEIGGDERARAREAELLRFQLDELDAAGLDDPDEDRSLRDEEDRLGDASAHRAALEALHDAVSGDGGAGDRLGVAVGLLAGRAPLADLHERLHGLVAELADVATDARARVESFDDDPARLAEISARRHALGDLRRKYGETLGEVIDYRDDARRRLAELDGHDAHAAALAVRQARAEADVAAQLARVGDARRAAAGPFAGRVERRLRELALPSARFEVEVSDDPGGSTVTWLLGANPGEPALPLTKVASGGELARTMLAVRLVLSGAGAAVEEGRAARTLVFDEVDAGIGGEAAIAVGRALAALGRHHQVLVVTHLPQVAAFADHQIAVTKVVEGRRTQARVEAVDGEARVVELSRMLSGRPDSDTARRHAAELLGLAADEAAPRPTVRSRTRSAR